MATDTVRKIKIIFESDVDKHVQGAKQVEDSLVNLGTIQGNIHQKLVSYTVDGVKQWKIVQTAIVNTTKDLENFRKEAKDALGAGIEAGYIRSAKVVEAVSESTTKTLKRNAKERADIEKNTIKEVQSIYTSWLNEVKNITDGRLLAQREYANTAKGIEQKLADDIVKIQKQAQDKINNYIKQYQEEQKTAGQVFSAIGRTQTSSTTKIARLTTAADAAKQALDIAEAEQKIWKRNSEQFTQLQNNRVEQTNRVLELERLSLQRNGGQRAVLLQQQANHEIDIRRNYANTIAAIERQVASGMSATVAAQQAAVALQQMESALRSSRAALESHLTGVNDNSRGTQNLGIRVLEMIGLYRLWSSLINTVVAGLKSIPAAGIEMQSTISALHASFSIDPAKDIGSPSQSRGESLTISAMNMLQKEAERTGISILTLEKNYRTFLASATLAGESVHTADKIFQDLNTTITALHMSGDRAELTFLALAQMFNKGKIQSEELVKQLGNLLPGAFASFAAANGKSTEELISQMKHGAVRAHETVQKFIEFYAKGYAGAFALAADGLNANLGRLETAWINYSRALFIVSQESMTSVIKSTTEFLQSITPTEAGLQKLSEAIEIAKKGIIAVATVALVAFIPKIVETTVVINAMTLAMARNPFGLLAIGISYATYAAIQFQNSLDKIDYSKLTPQGLKNEISVELAKIEEAIENSKKNWFLRPIDGQPTQALEAEKEKLLAAYAAMGEIQKATEEEKIKTGKNLDEQMNGDFTKLKDKIFHNVTQYNEVVSMMQNLLEKQGGKFAPKGSSGYTEELRDQFLEYANKLLFKDSDKTTKKEEKENKKDQERIISERKEILNNYLQFLDREAKLEVDYEKGKLEELDRLYKLGLVTARDFYLGKEEIIISANSRERELLVEQRLAVEKELEFVGKQVETKPISFTIDETAVTKTTKGFIDKFKGAAQLAAEALRVPIEGVLAQWALETGYGQSIIPGSNNIGNIKGTLHGGVKAFNKQEGWDSYNKYSSLEESVLGEKGFIDLLSKKHYEFVRGTKTVEEYAKALKEAGYATDPKYVQKVIDTSKQLGIVTVENTGIETESTNTKIANGKRIEELQGKLTEIKEKEKLLEQNASQEFTKLNDQKLLELQKYRDALATPNEEYAKEVRHLMELAGAVDQETFSNEKLMQSIELLDQKRVKANQQKALSALRQVTPFEEYKITFDDKAINDALQRSISLAKDLKDTFGGVGEAIGGMIVASDQFAKTLNDIETQQRHARSEAEKRTALTDDPKEKAIIAGNLAKLEIQYANQARTAELKKYSDITNSAKSFFKEGTAGYKGMENATKVFRAFEMAQSIQSMVMQKDGIFQTVAAWIMGETTKTAATEASAATQVATNMVVGTSSAAVGVANQAQGDPYSAFPRMAAMAAIMAALGFATGFFGGGSAEPDYAKLTQEKTGTGTVLGDTKAKSESITKSMEILAENSSLDIPISNAMLNSLKNIEHGINGLAAFGAQQGWFSTQKLTANVPTGKLDDTFNTVATGILTGIGGLLLTNLLGIDLFGRTKELQDFGLTSNIVGRGYSKDQLHPASRGADWVDMGQSIEDIKANGIMLANYFSTHVTESFLGFTSDRRHWEGTEKVLKGTIPEQIGKIIANSATSITQAVSSLDPSLSGIEDRINKFVFRLGDISFKGKDGADRSVEDIQKDINAAFSKNFDELAKTVMSGLEPFQQVGEGYFQTLVRVSTGMEQAQAAADTLMLGNVVKYFDIIQVQGDVAVESLRQTILNLEKKGDGSFTGLGKIIETFQGTLSDEVSMYKDLIQVRKDLLAIGDQQVEVSSDLIKGAGGLQPLQAGLSDYRNNILDPYAQFVSLANESQETWRKIGIAVPQSRQELQYLIETITDPKLKGAILAQVPMLLQLEEAKGQADSARDSMKGLGFDVAEVDRTIANLTNRFTSFDEALASVSDTVDAFITKKDAAQIASEAQQSALDAMPELKKYGVTAGMSPNAVTSILQGLGFSGIQDYYNRLLADKNVTKDDPRIRYLAATGQYGVATKTTAQDILDQQNKAQTDAINTATKNSETFSKLMIDISQELATLGKSDVARGLANINNQLEDLVNKAAAAGQTISNLADISKAKTLEFLKPTIKEFANLGKSDIQIALEEAQLWRKEWLDAASDIAAKIGIPLKDVQDAINAIGDQKATNAIKSAKDALKSFQEGIADYVKTLERTKVGTPQQQFEKLQSDAIQIYQAAMRGDTKAMAKLQGIASEYVTGIETRYGSSQVARELTQQVIDALKAAPEQLTLQEVVQGTADAQLEATKALPQQIADAIVTHPAVAGGTAIIPAISTSSSSAGSAIVTNLETALAEMKKELIAIKENQVKQVDAIIGSDTALNTKLITVVSGSSDKSAKTIAYANRTNVELV